MRPTRPGGRCSIVGSVRGGYGVVKRERFNTLAAATRRQTSSGQAQAGLRRESVVRHLSKTAGVHYSNDVCDGFTKEYRLKTVLLVDVRDCESNSKEWMIAADVDVAIDASITIL